MMTRRSVLSALQEASTSYIHGVSPWSSLKVRACARFDEHIETWHISQSTRTHLFRSNEAVEPGVQTIQRSPIAPQLLELLLTHRPPIERGQVVFELLERTRR